jgi:hypothetical protein
MQGLELHFWVVQLAAGDCSASMAKTIDFADYQARRVLVASFTFNPLLIIFCYP